jgi:hypothetical protein
VGETSVQSRAAEIEAGLRDSLDTSDGNALASTLDRDLRLQTAAIPAALPAPQACAAAELAPVQPVRAEDEHLLATGDFDSGPLANPQATPLGAELGPRCASPTQWLTS